jgi:uncharacterized membrane protein
MSPAGLSVETWLIILIGLVTANIAFFSPKFLFFKNLPDKHVGWCLLEMLVWYVLVGVVAYILETMIGNTFPKRWEFYAVTVCLILVAAYTGFKLRFLVKHRQSSSN